MSRVCRQLGVAVAALVPLFTFAQPDANKLLEAMTFRNVGPATVGGRILDIESPVGKPSTIFIGTADAGVWKSLNNGTTWEPLFDAQSASSVGDVALCAKNTDLIWVGTGENTSTRSAHYGDGVYKSTDGGKTWANMGLKDSRRIGRIVIDPKNTETVYVASLGFLYKEGGDRGIYKTTDGGKTWNQILKGENATTGFVDIAMDPKDSKVLYAASQDRLRRPWAIRENGKGSGIYKSTDAGKTWNKLAGGLPSGDNVARICVTVFAKDSKLVYAFIDIKGDPGAGLWRSMDAGKTWTKSAARLGGGAYYSQVFVSPTNPDDIYCPNVNLMHSKDGGKTFTSASTRSHVDWHSVWMNPADPDHIRASCDGGMYFTYDGFQTNSQITNLPFAQFYAVSADNAVPYNVMGGLQDNGSWRGPSRTPNSGGIFNWHWNNIIGGDGFYNLAHPVDTDIIFASSQFGAVQRSNMADRTSRSIRPRDTGQRANWMSPFFISPHDNDTIYWGGNKLYKSLNRGDTWKTVSPDLTTNDAEKIKGNVPHCTITTIDESRKQQGVIWAGTDDGNVWITQDDGNSWTALNPNIPDAPAKYWISRVHASPHDAGTAFMTITGFREDDWTPYAWKTTDFGKTWTRLKGLPDEQISVIKQDAINPNLLFVGTEVAAHVSFDGGGTWNKLKGVPTVGVQDLVIQERESDLVLGTHGRGIYIADITPYRQLTAEVLGKNSFLFKPTRALSYNFISDMFEPFQGHSRYAGKNPEYGAAIWFYLKADVADAPKIEILDITGTAVATLTGSKTAGLNVARWNLRGRGGAATGQFLVRMTVGTEIQSQILNVEAVKEMGQAVIPEPNVRL